MSALDLAPVPTPTAPNGPPLKHLARPMQRWDHQVETLCGLVRTVKPPRKGAARCQDCLEVAQFVGQLVDL